jgi:hypothetical protein
MASEEVPSTTVNNEEEPLFDPALKKKRNKKVIDFDLDALDTNGAADATPTEAQESAPPAAAEAEADDMFDGLKKKSKKKKAIPMDLVSLPECCYIDFADISTRIKDEGEPSVAVVDEVKVDDAAAEAADAVPDGELDVSSLFLCCIRQTLIHLLCSLER